MSRRIAGFVAVFSLFGVYLRPGLNEVGTVILTLVVSHGICRLPPLSVIGLVAPAGQLASSLRWGCSWPGLEAVCFSVKAEREPRSLGRRLSRLKLIHASPNSP